MTANATGRGPDIVIAGSARSATSALATALGVHPDSTPAKSKTGLLSRHFERGFEWYDGLYDGPPVGLSAQARRERLVHLADLPSGLRESGHDLPDPFMIYCVRDPIDRAVSHYLYRRHYFKIEPADSFGSALSESSYYLLSSDYAAWLSALTSHFPRLLVVPFEAVTGGSHAVAAVICRQVDSENPPSRETSATPSEDVMEDRK